MTLTATGAIAIKDAGSNPSTTSALETSWSPSTGSLTLRRASIIYDPEPGVGPFYSYDTVRTGTLYNYSHSSGSLKGTNPQATVSGMSGFTSRIGAKLYTYMGTYPPNGGPDGYGGGEYWQDTSDPVYLGAVVSSMGGSLGTTTFTSASGVSHQIRDVGLGKNSNGDSGNGANQQAANMMIFTLDGNHASGATNDNTFYSVTIRKLSSGVYYDTTFYRTGADNVRYDTTNGNTIWEWNNETDAIIDYSSPPTHLRVNYASAQSKNNGIVEEFGDTSGAPHAMSEFYRGGNNVGNTNANASIPTSGTIRLSNFYGGEASGSSSSGVHATQMNAGYYNGQYYNVSGVWNPGSPNTGSFVSPNVSSMNGSSYAKLTGLYTIGTALIFRMAANGVGSVNFQNVATSSGGWDTLKIYNNSSGSGSPLATLNRTSGSFSTQNNNTSSAVAYWTYTGYSQSTYFGTSSSSNWYISIT